MKDVFILGAGFSKAIHKKMPTLNELSKRIITNLKKDVQIPRLLNELEPNIELWITYLSQGQPWLTDSENLYNQHLAGLIREQIADIIGNAQTDAESQSPEWLKRLIKSWHQQQATVITLNYDTLIEKTTREIVISEDNLDKIIPVQIYPPYFANIRSRSGAGLWGTNKIATFSLMKLHGSVRRQIIWDSGG